jgi:hypothetical protein
MNENNFSEIVKNVEVTFKNLILEDLVSNDEVESSYLDNLVLNVEIERSYTLNEQNLSLGTLKFPLRLSRSLHSPTITSLEQEEYYSDHPTARLEWSVDRDEYTTEKFEIYIEGKNQECEEVSGNFVVLEKDFTNLDENKHYSNDGTQAKYSLLLNLNGTENENLKNMFSISKVDVERKINLTENTNGKAKGPVNELSGTDGNATLKFEFEPVISDLTKDDVSFDAKTVDVTVTLDNNSDKLTLLGMLSYTTDNSGVVNEIDISQVDQQECDLSYTFNFETNRELNQEDFDNGKAQFAVIAINSKGVSTKTYKKTSDLITLADLENNAPNPAPTTSQDTLKRAQLLRRLGMI